MAKKSKTDRNNKWTFIMYPESCPDNYIDVLKDFKVQFLMSPLHDKDKTENGDIKKPHWHVVLYFDSLKSQAQIKELIEPLNCPSPEGVLSPTMIIRYLLHMDDVDKVLYKKEDILIHGPLDILVEDALKNQKNKRVLLLECFQFISEHDIVEYCDIVDHVLTHRLDWFDIVIGSHSYSINNYINSARNKRK